MASHYRMWNHDSLFLLKIYQMDDHKNSSLFSSHVCICLHLRKVIESGLKAAIKQTFGR